MDDARIVKLLEEIRDLQQDHAANYRDAVRNQQESIRNQQDAIRYQRTVTRRLMIFLAPVILLLLLLVGWLMVRLGPI